MKKILIPSIILNILLISVYVYKTQTRTKKFELPETSKIFAQVRKDIFNELPIDSNDVVFLGNSLTEAFPVNELFGAKNRGVSGNRSYQILDRVSQVKPAKRVFLMVGVNDIKDREPVKQVLKIVSIIIDSLKHNVVVQSVLPTSGNYSGLNDGIKELNLLLKGYCEKNNIPFIDLHSCFLPFEQYTFDGLHLNSKGYKLWAEKVNSFIITSPFASAQLLQTPVHYQ